MAKQYIWIELAKLDNTSFGIVMDELMRLAVDSGIDSLRCVLIADVIMTLSSIQVRSHTIDRLRQARKSNSI